MKPLLPLILIILLCLGQPSTAKAASGTVGNGGIDVILTNGEMVPIETYLENHSTPIANLCSMPLIHKNMGSHEEWKKTLNQVFSKLHQLSPKLAYSAFEQIVETNYFFTNFQGNVKIKFTNDDNNVLDSHKKNGAIRLGNDVYFSSSSWGNFWTNKNKKYPYQKMLTRVFHEAYLPVFKNNRYALGKYVVELLRASGHYPETNGHPVYTLIGKKGEQLELALGNFCPRRRDCNLDSTLSYYVSGYIESKRYKIYGCDFPNVKNVSSDCKDWNKVKANFKKYEDSSLPKLLPKGYFKDGQTYTYFDRKRIDLTYPTLAKTKIFTLADFKKIFFDGFLKSPIYIRSTGVEKETGKTKTFTVHKFSIKNQTDYQKKKFEKLRSKLAKPPVLCQ